MDSVALPRQSALTHLLKPLRFHLISYNLITVRYIFCSPKDHIPVPVKSVHKLQCSDCLAVYIGESGHGVLEHFDEASSSSTKELAFA